MAMFRRSVLTGSLAILVFNLFGAGAVQANDHAEEVFNRCQHELELLTQECVRTNYDITVECVDRIRQLLHEGRIEEAFQLARQCIRLIHHQTWNCLRQIEELCADCIHQLRAMGAFKLAHHFERNCLAAEETVIASARHSIHAIKSLFDGR